MLQVSFIAAALCAVAVVVGVPMLRPHAHVPRDPGPLAAAVLDALPGGNCGACGNDSCFEAAARVAAGRAPADVCATGGPSTAAAVAAALHSMPRRA
jgi:Na+-translocating ferredoxin:NAD+ oxidoreductase RNF subunit RnfB